MLTLTHASLATIDQLFSYKDNGFKLDPFPGYTDDQWGIKAHNRPWIEEAGNFNAGQRIIEVGGAYSLLPKYLGDKYKLEPWIGDDFGESFGELELWSRWGNPKDLPHQYPDVKYIFKPFGKFSDEYPSKYFDRLFSVSTLEHIPYENRLDVFRDMNRIVAKNGIQLHTIDVSSSFARVSAYSVMDQFPRVLSKISKGLGSEIRSWINIIERSGVKIGTKIPNSFELLNRQKLVESPDVIYRFYPPNNSKKQYYPCASLLVVIQDV